MSANKRGMRGVSVCADSTETRGVHNIENIIIERSRRQSGFFAVPAVPAARDRLRFSETAFD